MSIINVTPDSFYAPSRSDDFEDIGQRAREMIDHGAQIIDIGGFSSRPNADFVSVEQETQRVLRGVEAVRAQSKEVVISVDSFRSEVVESVVERFGAVVVNDISAGRVDDAMIDVAVKYNLPYVLMHNAIESVENIHPQIEYNDIVKDVYDFFAGKIKELETRGVKEIVLDPGFGFSKSVEDNLRLMEGMECFKDFGRAILVGISNKRVAVALGGDSESGTRLLNAEALKRGANILRVHNTLNAMTLIEEYDRV